MKRLSLLLILTLVISLLPSYSSASAASIADYSLAPQFLEAVQIENPVASKADTDAVTRAEALTVLVRLFGYRTDSIATVPFTDVKDDISGELKYALDSGMISSSDAFRPDDAITYNEAIKMCVVALGYDYLAKAYGGWPVGYIKMASDVNLSDGLPLSENTISKSGFYAMIENLLTAEMLKLDGMVDDEISYERYTTVLETYFNMYEIEGVVTANEHTGLYSVDQTLSENTVAINDYKFNYQSDVNLIGYNVKGYVYSDNDKIALITPNANNTKTVDFADMVSHSGNLFTYYDGAKETKLRLDTPTAYIYNGKSYEQCRLKDYQNQDGYLVFVDNDSDNVYEVCNVYHRSTILVSGVNAEEGYITDENGARRIDLSNDDCKYFISENGTPKTLTDIKAGMLLSCFVSVDEFYVEIIIEPESVSGVITGFNTDARIIVIDDKEYTYSRYFERYYLSKQQSGKEISVLLSSGGLVEAASDSVLDGMNFGYYIDVARDTGLEDTITVKLVAKDGVIITPEADKKIKFDGNTYSTPTAIASLFFDNSGNKLLASQIVRYKLSSDGKLSVLDTVSAAEGYITSDDDYENNLKKYAYPEASTDLLHEGIWVSTASNIVHPWYMVNDNTFFIQVSSNEAVSEEQRYVVRDLAWLKANRNFKRVQTSVYNVDDNCIAGAMMFEEAASLTLTDDSPRGIIQSVSTAFDENQNECIKLVIYNKETYSDYYLRKEDFPYPIRSEYSSDTAYQNAVNATPFDEHGNPRYGVGDYVAYQADSANYFSALRVEYDASARQLLYKNTNQMYFCYYYGGVYSIGNGVMTMIRASADGTNLDINHQRYVFRIPTSVYIYDTKNGEITTTTADSLETYLQVGDLCSRVLVTTNDLNIQSCIIYR